MTQTLETDYLIVGSGAMGMAFADVILNETEASIVLVDRHHRPGGHWNDAYPFVRLHQPSAFYGVNSRPLGNDTIDATGWNQGLYELASAGEVCAYFDHVMQRQLLASGRVRYFPMCDYTGADNGTERFRSRTSDEEYAVTVNRKTVDATYMNVTVPSVTPPAWRTDPAATCIPLNDLARIERPPAGYVIIGAGKTGMDACLFLLANGVDPDAITWVMPRDSWILDRANIQPGKLAGASIASAASDAASIAQSESIDALFAAVEAAGGLMRIDPDVKPTMYRCATCTTLELEQLRRISNVVRLGHVTEIGRDTITLDGGTLPTSPDHLHVNCSADGLSRRPPRPVFTDARLTLQSVRTCQQVFSAAFIAHVEAAYPDDETKNRLCGVVPHPDSDIDFLRTSLAATQNQTEWAQDPDLQQWLAHARLDGFSQPPREGADLPSAAQLARLQAGARAQVERLQALLAAVD